MQGIHGPFGSDWPKRFSLVFGGSSGPGQAVQEWSSYHGFESGGLTQALSGRSKEVKVDVPYSKCKLILELRIVLCKSYPTVQFHPKNRPN